MTDLIYNHITGRIPGSADHLLINLYGMLYKEITPRAWSRSRSKARSSGSPHRLRHHKSGYVIHGAIHKARPEVQLRAAHAYARRHGGRGDACGLLRFTDSIRFVGHIGYHDYGARRSISTSASASWPISGPTTR